MPDPQPLPEICPFLASINDPDSVYNYPSEENRCGKPGGQLPIASDYQLAYCLRTRHWFCPVFTGAVKKPPVPIRFEGSLGEIAKNNAPLTLPSVPRLDKLAPVVSNEGRPEPGRSTRGLMILFLLCLLGIGLGSVILLGGRLNEVVSSASPTIAMTTATDTATPSATDTLSPTASLTNTEIPSETATSLSSATSTLTVTVQASATSTLTSTVTAANLTLKACTPPANWQAYTVAVGETYYKIAVKFNTTVDALQRVNCLSNPGKLLAGQTIYVPPLTATP